MVMGMLELQPRVQKIWRNPGWHACSPDGREKDNLLTGSKTNTGEVPAASAFHVCWHVQQKRNAFAPLGRGRQDDGRLWGESRALLPNDRAGQAGARGRGSDSQATGTSRWGAPWGSWLASLPPSPVFQPLPRLSAVRRGVQCPHSFWPGPSSMLLAVLTGHLLLHCGLFTWPPSVAGICHLSAYCPHSLDSACVPNTTG